MIADCALDIRLFDVSQDHDAKLQFLLTVRGSDNVDEIVGSPYMFLSNRGRCNK